MGWRYCIARERDNDENFFSLRELHTGTDGTLSWTAPVVVCGYSLSEIQDQLSLMFAATASPMLDLTVEPAAPTDSNAFNDAKES